MSAAWSWTRKDVMGAEVEDRQRTGLADDRSIAERLVAGDESALDEVYDLYSALVHGVALRTTRDRIAAEDVTQEVFVQVWEKIDRFDAERGSLRAWIATIAHRRSVDHVRRETARTRVAVTAVGSTHPSAEDEAVVVMLADRVRAAVDLLPEAQREVVRLAYYEDHSLVQAAVKLGIPEGTAKSRMRHALMRLSDSLTGEGMRSN
ncbi:RNA polymerase sigma factor [Cryptosporangium aurantiacum]|nr:sigma-70 family RNA polymerase sigma factor [Cryptosporangium aurantiacum]